MLDVKNVSIRDKPKAITAEDVIRRYNLEQLKSDRKAIRTLNDGLTKTNTLVENFIINISNHVENQEDGFITTWFSNELPTLQNFPFKDFEKEEKENRIGDIVYDRESGNVYQLEYENSEYVWLQLDDEYLKESLAIANAAADTYDNKRNLYFSEPTTPYDAGDMWYTNGLIKRCRCSRDDQGYHAMDWVLQRDYTDESVLQETRAVLNQFKIEIERDYVTSSSLETAKNSIEAKVQSNTTEIAKFNNEVVGVKETINSLNTKITDAEFDVTAMQTQLENGLQTANTKLANFQVAINEIKGVVEASTDTTKTESGIGVVTINGLMNSEVIMLKVHPTNTDLAYLYPSDNLYPSDSLYLKSRILLFQSEEETVEFDLPCDLWFYNKEIYDEFILDLENNEMFCIKRVGIDISGNKYALENEEMISYTFQSIVLSGGNYTVKFLSFDDAYISVQGLTININNSQFIPRVEAKSIVKQASDRLEEKVNLKVGTNVFESYRTQTAALISEKVSNNEYESYKTQTANSFNQTIKKGNVISEINQSAESTKIKAEKINLEGYVTVTSLKTSGSTIINGSNITTGTIDANKVNVKNINASFITTGTLSCDLLKGGTITGQKISGGTLSGTLITCNSGKIANWTITTGKIYGGDSTTGVAAIQVPSGNMQWVFAAGGTSHDSYANCPFRVSKSGDLYATRAHITGSITATSGSFTGSVYASGGTIGGFNIATDRLYYGNTAINRNGNVEFRNDNGYLSIGNVCVNLNGSGMRHPVVISDQLACGSTGDSNASIGIRAFYGNVKIASNEWLNMSGALGAYLNNQHYAGTSSRNTKKNIKELTESQIDEVYDIFKNLKFYQYDYQEAYGGIKNNYGFLIEDIENTILDKIMHIFRDDKDKNYKNYNSEDLTRLLLITMQKIMKEVESMKEMIKL